MIRLRPLYYIVFPYSVEPRLFQDDGHRRTMGRAVGLLSDRRFYYHPGPRYRMVKP